MRVKLSLLLAAVAFAWLAASTSIDVAAQSSGYRLVPGWPKLPPGTYFGSKNPLGPSPNTSRDEEGQKNETRTIGQLRATPEGPVAKREPRPGADPWEGSGASGLVIDAQDHLYVFNRGHKPVMVFDREGDLLRSGGDIELNGVRIASAGLHSGNVDDEGNVYVVDEANARVVKLNPTLDKLLLQIGTTGVTGHDGTHLNLPSGLAILHNGNIVVTDGYANNRLAMFDKNGKFIKQASKGAGSPTDIGNGPGEFSLPHKVAVDADDNIYAVDRENYRIAIFDKNLKYLRSISEPGWNPWDIAMPIRNPEKIAFVPDHTTEQVIKFSLVDGKILARFGKFGRNPGEFDWVHGVAVDSQGGVYVCDTYGQHVQKFVPQTS